MAEPLTPNKNFTAPLTGDLVGSWGTAAVNANMSALDGILGGFATLSLSSATTIALTVPSGAAFTPGGGPTQSQNALLKFTGTLTGNAVIQFQMPGFFIVHNACTVGNFVVKLSPSSGGGNSICAPPGEKCHVFFDGTDMDYVDLGRVGSAFDLHGASSLPPWIGSCSVQPYLIKDGSVYTASIYPALAAILGSTFGGNGITTFGVPDERSRARIPIDTNGPGSYAGRITAAGSGINGTTMGAAGGSEFLQQHSHTVTDPGHVHSGVYSMAGRFINTFVVQFNIGSGEALQRDATGSSAITSASATTSITLGNTGTGSSQNMIPSIVSFLPLIRSA